MGLRCLLGHDFTEPRTERDREERGDEVVATITEVKECKRCGETRVISENTEVTALTTHAEPNEHGTDSDVPSGTGSVDVGAEHAEFVDEAEGTAPADPAGGPESDEGVEVAEPTESVADDAEVADDDAFDHPTADPAADEVPADVEEDAEIIDSDGNAVADAADADAVEGRAHGEWPDADANRGGEEASTAEPAAWPEDEQAAAADDESADAAHSPAEGESEDVEFIGGEEPDSEDEAANEARTDVVPDAANADGADAVPAGEDDAEFIDGDGPDSWPEQRGEDEGYDAEVGGEDGDVSVDGNLTPQVDADAAADEDVEFIEADPSPGQSAPHPSARNGSTADSAATEPDEGSSRPSVELTTTADRVETVYVCPDCGNREAVGASSMRAGDICPDCKRGYIEERELQ